ncbi:MAG: hypothetical protein U1B83_02015, partial [Candidatus Cloacimonadaceae bacterium]|nr:hypothetical protein [Candidatus Cloacimonadaceae bacterium]
MKNMIKITFLLSLVTLFVAGCQTSPTFPEANLYDASVNHAYTVNSQAMQYPIWAGQSINAGTLSIHNDAQYLYVSYSMNDDWMLEQTHVHIAKNINQIPMTRKGIPIPGQFQYSTTHNPNIGLYSYQILLADHNLIPGDNILVAAHASVVRGSLIDNTYQQETGWGGNVPGPGTRWWFFATYTLTTPPRDGEDPVFNTETAMMRMNDLPNDFSYPWGTHPWFTYAVHKPGSTPSTFYFYAAQHYRVGEVDIWKDAGKLYVNVRLDAPYQMTESHLNVQLGG